MSDITELQAINRVLRAIGARPVEAVPPSNPVEEYNLVKDAFDSARIEALVSREWEVLTRGRDGTSVDIASSAGTVALPAGTLRVALRPDDSDYGKSVDVRNGFLWDVDADANNTWTGTKKLRLTEDCTFASLPVGIKPWVVARAKYISLESKEKYDRLPAVNRELAMLARMGGADARFRNNRSILDGLYQKQTALRRLSGWIPPAGQRPQ